MRSLWKASPQFVASKPELEWNFAKNHDRNRETLGSQKPLIPTRVQYQDGNALMNSLERHSDKDSWF